MLLKRRAIGVAPNVRRFAPGRKRDGGRDLPPRVRERHEGEGGLDAAPRATARPAVAILVEGTGSTLAIGKSLGHTSGGSKKGGTLNASLSRSTETWPRG